MTATVETPIDLGPCGWCEHLQWAHKRGKNGCKELGCPCGKYEPPKAKPAPDPLNGAYEQAVEQIGGGFDVEAGLAEIVERPDGPDLGVCVGGFEPAQPGDVELPAEPAVDVDPAVKPPLPPADFLAAHTMVGERAAAGAGWQVGYLAGQAAAAAASTAEREHMELNPTGTAEWLKNRLNELAVELERARNQRDAAWKGNSQLAVERDRARADLDGARGALVEAGRAGARDRKAHAAELDHLRIEVAELRAALQGPVPDAAVLYRYDGDQCTTEGCGSRYTVPVEHPHPLIPVTVLIVRREVPGA